MKNSKKKPNEPTYPPKRETQINGSSLGNV